jgi:RimJ/RimL family protein N-acetyltransferase
MHLAPDYPVLTARLALRPLDSDDLDTLTSYRSDPEVCRYVPFDFQDRARLEELLTTRWQRHTIDDEGQNLNLGVHDRTTGVLFGDVMLAWHSREHSGGEIGYMFSPTAASHGYATEAMHAVLHLGFDDLGLHRLMARIDARNAASIGVCERLGMRQEALLIQNEWFKGEWTDEVDYGLLQDEWVSRSVGPGDCPRCHQD